MTASRKPKIRPFHRNDHGQTLDLWKRANLPMKPDGRDRLSRIEREIKRSSTFFRVAEVDGRIIGTVLATHDGRKGWINRLAVHPDFQGRGIGRMLLRLAERFLTQAGIDIIACLIEGDNPLSMAFFAHAGYTKHESIVYFTKKKFKGI